MYKEVVVSASDLVAARCPAHRVEDSAKEQESPHAVAQPLQ